ncbi:MAG: Crp/Fnr family transcriptional regulator [Proteobacteria bacterium]|nr:Crp/Fnr family transcriptional regulator [Pseudomonadota bacterium]
MDIEQALEKHGKSFEPGSVLFYEGDPGTKIWVINEGHIQLTKRVCNEEIILETLGPGEFCGELSLVTNSPQPSTATVVDKARLLEIDAHQFGSMMGSSIELTLRMFKKVAGRLNEANFRVSVMQMRNPLGRVMLVLRHEISRSEAPNKATIPSDLADLLGIDDAELNRILDKLVEKSLITLSKEKVYSIVDKDEYARFLSFLELNDRYEFALK